MALPNSICTSITYNLYEIHFNAIDKYMFDAQVIIILDNVNLNCLKNFRYFKSQLQDTGSPSVEFAATSQMYSNNFVNNVFVLYLQFFLCGGDFYELNVFHNIPFSVPTTA